MKAPDVSRNRTFSDKPVRSSNLSFPYNEQENLINE